MFRLVAILFFGPIAAASAHPHVEIEVQAEVQISGGTVTGVWTTWTFDEMYSQVIMADCDPDDTGKIDPTQVSLVKKGYFDYLRNSRYFSHFTLGDKGLAVPEPQKFEARTQEEGRVVFRFFLPVQVRLDPRQPFGLSFYDPDYFCAMAFNGKTPVSVTGTDSGRAGVTFRPNKKEVYYDGAVTPVFAYITWKPAG